MLQAVSRSMNKERNQVLPNKGPLDEGLLLYLQ
ncbi:hypothetical protein PAESOLCIP111_02922 [Paenibacillus solanacearum]|uniref:Uncharacterized protein n=1 Tax=Paenibacillus solanacearum TaxID=2048548 RepID=A0A916K592_9BACL|nr:hypothetical protein PAESOLCIP111_02922 [Paenibacillus solanacearum]